MPLNLGPLEHYRLQNPTAFEDHCRQPGSLVAGERTERNGLVMHRPDLCTELQKRLILGDVNLDEYPKFGIYVADFPAFQALAQEAGVPLFFTCRTPECRNLQRTLAIP
jgi:hypothetical protein